MTKKWEKYRPLIMKLYKEENRPLREVKKILSEEYNFNASTRAFRTRFEKWKISKYNCSKRRNSAGSLSSPPWRADSTPIASPTMPVTTHIVGSGSPSPQCQMSLPLPAPYREPTGPLAPPPSMSEVARYDTQANLRRVAFDLPMRPAQYPLCPPDASPVSSSSEPPYLGYFGMPLIYTQELSPQHHEQFRLESFTALEDGEYKTEYLKHEVEP